jgi:hypothetical protein
MYSSQALYMLLLLLLLLLLRTEHAVAVSQATALMQQAVCKYIYCCGVKRQLIGRKMGHVLCASVLILLDHLFC